MVTVVTWLWCLFMFNFFALYYVVYLFTVHLFLLFLSLQLLSDTSTVFHVCSIYNHNFVYVLFGDGVWRKYTCHPRVKHKRDNYGERDRHAAVGTRTLCGVALANR